MKLDELGYNSSIRDKVFERIWEIIGNNFMIKVVPVENKEGNVIVLPDDIYWECDKIVKLNKEGFNQKWTYYRPSIFATNYNLTKAGCLIYNETWYNKMLNGEAKRKNEIGNLINNNKATVEQVSEYFWNGVDLNQIGVWGIKSLSGKILGLYLSLDESFNDIWKREKEEQSLFCYEKMNNNGLKYESILSIADMVVKDNKISKDDMYKIYIGLCEVLKPVDINKKRIKGKIIFDFGEPASMND